MASLKAQTVNKDTAFKIVGYYSLQSALKNDFKSFPFEKITHIDLYFLNPDSLGNFHQNLTALISFINAAHAKHVKVLVSIGGGGKHPYYAKLLKDSSRTTLVNKLIAIAVKYNLDGIDVDLEDKDIDEYYENFVTELASRLHEYNKIITAAIAIYFEASYSDKALAQFDFVNLMSYDHTGAWAPQKPGPHATYLQAFEDLAYFRIIRGIPKEKITLGVPFYGYGFGPDLVKRGITMNYDHIVAKFSGAENKDETDMGKGRTMYYNGMPTIKMKTALAGQEAAGIMIWQLSGDAPPPNSLLDAINETVKKIK